MTEGLQPKPSFLAMSASRPLSLIDCATCSNEDPYPNPNPIPSLTPTPAPTLFLSISPIPTLTPTCTLPRTLDRNSKS
jgi:hypothetical protein